MRIGHARGMARLAWLTFLAAVTFAAMTGSAAAQGPSLDELLSGIVRVKTFINPDAQTLENLGRERSGSGVVIDNNGLVLTIGYLMVEAHAAEVETSDGRSVPANVVGYDQETGFVYLRRKLDAGVRSTIHTVHGVGYCLSEAK